MKEEFKPIPGFEGRYSISPSGRVMSHHTNMIRKTCISRDGYEKITLFKDGIVYCYEIHRLVGMTWLDKPEGEGWEIDHADTNKLNNNVSNLRWVKHSENQYNRNN